MPRLDDPKIKLKTGKPFKRKGLRPWDNPDEFKPSMLSHEKIQNELATNKEPISKQLVNNKETIGKQLVNNEDVISKQLVNRDQPISKQLVNNKETIGKQIDPVISKQLVNKKGAFSEDLDETKKLSGLQKKLLSYIVEDCASRGLLYTTQITNEALRSILNTDAHSVKTTVQRLINKKIINRQDGKRGKGGYTIFAINESVRNAAIELHRQLSISKQLVNANSKQLVNNWETNRFLSSSSNNINTTTDLGTNPGEEMSADWQTVDFSVLADIGFNKTHLAQLYKAGTQDPKIVQDSIYHFAFDLKHNGKKSGIKGDVLNFFMGIISKRAYTAPTNYINPDVEAMNAYIKTKEQEQKQKEELELKTQDLEFNHWHETLSDEEINQLVSSDTKTAGIPKQLQQTLKMNQLKKHFKNFVWPDVKRRILTSTPNWKNT